MRWQVSINDPLHGNGYTEYCTQSTQFLFYNVNERAGCFAGTKEQIDGTVPYQPSRSRDGCSMFGRRLFLKPIECLGDLYQRGFIILKIQAVILQSAVTDTSGLAQQGIQVKEYGRNLFK